MRHVVATVVLLMNNANAGWIDTDTTEEHMTTKSLVDGSTYQLVMSDEFNVPNRNFADGSDPMWTALDKSDDDANAVGGGSLHFYNSSTVTTTEDGQLEIKSYMGKTEWDHYDVIKKKYRKIKKDFKSGMVQSWDKFCFTGGIVEIDMTFPGEHNIGGLWPAAWILGNLGRATYEATTNNIWPWSFDSCDRSLQQAQTISACNNQNHYGLERGKGRGATEIDIIEVMTGKPGPLPNTDPQMELPYVDLTLQVAPGITKNRPTEGYQPIRKSKISATTGHVQSVADNWYDIQLYGNTSLNPFFYGTYLGETKPEEPVQRTKYQAFQADAVGAMHQVTPRHFNTSHSFRIEWQPGTGGRLDWFVKAYRTNATSMDGSIEGDGQGQEWVKVLSITDEAIKEMTGAQIPAEPSYLIFNTAISSTWGFPFKVPAYCKACYDCSNPECWCNFNPGFCQMMERNVSFLIDFVRVYQKTDQDSNHTVGCDPVDYPTKEWIQGHAHMYTRPAPFGYNDYHPIKKVKKGGGSCQTDQDCGAPDSATTTSSERKLAKTRGTCVPSSEFHNKALQVKITGNVCKCNPGFTGPHCLAIDHHNDQKGAYELGKRSFETAAHPYFPDTLSVVALVLVAMMLIVMVMTVKLNRRRNRADGGTVEVTFHSRDGGAIKKPVFKASGWNHGTITGRSV